MRGAARRRRGHNRVAREGVRVSAPLGGSRRWKPQHQPGRGGEQQIFPASRLWLGTLGVVIVCAGLALALIIGTGSSGALCLLFIAAAIFGPASVLFYAARREVVLDDEGVLVRTPKGTTALELPWKRRSPTRSTNSARRAATVKSRCG
ncbi:MAG: hypothetical protein U0232_05730 [Thermomicrobiales bacterium]